MGFKRTSVDERKQEFKEAQSRGPAYLNLPEGVELFKPKNGENMIRVLPPQEGEEFLKTTGYEVRKYYVANKTWVSPKTFGKSTKDPFFDYWMENREKSEDINENFRPTTRRLWFILDLNDEEAGKLSLWEAPMKLSKEIIARTQHRRTGELINFDDPEDGVVIFFHKEGEKLATEYTRVELSDEKFPLDEQLADEIPLLEDLIVVPDASEMEAFLESYTGSGEQEEEEAPARTGWKRPERPASSNTPEANPEPAREEEPAPAAKEESSGKSGGLDDEKMARLRERLRSRKSE